MEKIERWHRLLGAVADRGLAGIERVLEIGHKGMPPDASILSNPRLILCLKGTAHYEGQCDGKPGVFRLGRGGALFVGPDKWIRAAPRRPYLVLGLVFETESLRFYLLEPGSDKGSRCKTHPRGEFVFGRPLPEEGRVLCRVLGSDGGSRLYHRRLAEALVELCRSLLCTPVVPVEGKARRTWQAAARYVADHLQEPLGREQVAEHLRIHPNHLSRLCAMFSGTKFAHYIQDRRLERARLLLADDRLNVGEAAALSGFGSANYFIRLYRERYGTTPGAGREASFGKTHGSKL